MFVAEWVSRGYFLGCYTPARNMRRENQIQIAASRPSLFENSWTVDCVNAAVVKP